MNHHAGISTAAAWRRFGFLVACALLGWCSSAEAQYWTQTSLLPDSNQDVYLTGDGAKIAFTHYATNWWNVWTINADGSNLTRVTNYPATYNGDETPAISDDGLRIVFMSNADPLGTNPEGNAEIFTVNADGTGLTQITVTTGGYGFMPEITDDGSRISFTMGGADLTGQNPDLGGEVYVANFDGSGLAQASNLPSGGATGSISGDGSTVVWSPTSFGMNTVYRCNPDGSGTTPLVTLNDAFVLPRHCVTDDGSLAVFRSNDDPFGTNADGNNEVFAVDTQTANCWQVTQTVDTGGLGNANLRAFVSGMGSLILFNTQNDITGENPDFAGELFITCTDGSNLKQITNSTAAVPTNVDYRFITIDDRGDVIALVASDTMLGGGRGPFTLWRLDSVEPDGDGDGVDDACAAGGGAVGGPDVQVNQDPPGRLQNETSLTMNPVTPGNFVMAFNDFPYAISPGLGVAHSTDWGATWTHQNLLWPGGYGFVDAFDPITASDTIGAGNMYTGFITTDGTFTGNAALVANASTDGGATWPWQTIIDFAPGSRFVDKPHMASDTDPGSPYLNRVYVAWIQEGIAGPGPWSDICFTRSQTLPPAGFAFWPLQVISDLPTGVGMSNGPNIAVAPDGTVYVAWLDCDVTQNGQLPGVLYVDRSYDGGVTFGVDTMIRQILTLPDRLSNFNTPLTDAVARSYPSMEVSTLNSQEVYIVYAEDQDGAWTGDEADVFFIKSTNGGYNWSAPLQLNLFSGGHEFEPWIDVKPDGTIDVIWYEAGPNDMGPYWNVMITRSRDRGNTWATPMPLNDAIFPTPINPWGQPWLGEYPALVVDNTNAYVGFTSSVNDPQGDVFFDVVENDDLPTPGFADLDGDGDVDLTDLATLLANYGATGGATYAMGDLDGDGDVDLADLAALLALYGTVYP
jgi:Tol biopolymer transport system component